jgi:hypothetical protein
MTARWLANLLEQVASNMSEDDVEINIRSKRRGVTAIESDDPGQALLNTGFQQQHRAGCVMIGMICASFGCKLIGNAIGLLDRAMQRCMASGI